jgi:integrase
LDLPLSALTDDRIKEYFDSLPVSPASRKKYASALKVIYAFGAKKCNLPITRLNYSPKVKRRDYSIYTQEQYMEFRKHLTEMGRVFFDLLYFTGMRKGEALALDVQDVGEVIRITKTIDIKGVVTLPKTDSSVRNVAIPKFLQDELNEYISKLPEGELQPLFPVTASYFYHHHRKAEKLAGLHHIRIHDFRHSHASYLIAKGVNIADISKRLGHASIGITLQTYAHLYNDHDKDIAEMLEKSVRNP